MLSTGIDLVEVNRIETAVARYGARFLERVFTDGELARCRGQPQQLAARFAAKEAVSKALGTGIQSGWREIEIVSDPRGKPSVRLSGSAAQRAAQIGLQTFALSLSHTRDYAIALVIAN